MSIKSIIKLAIRQNFFNNVFRNVIELYYNRAIQNLVKSRLVYPVTQITLLLIQL